MPVQWNTVAIPFAQGIQPSARGRLLDMMRLLRAENCVYTLDQGPQKRAGHMGRAIKSSAPPYTSSTEQPVAPQPRAPYSFANPGLPAGWLHGYGLLNEADPGSTDTYHYSPDPRVGLAFGQATRDDEVISWDGHRGFSFAAAQTSLFGQLQSGTTHGPAVMPAMRVEPYAKVSAGQFFPDACDNGVVRTAVWLTASPVGIEWMTTDSTTGAILHHGVEAIVDPLKLRVLTVGPWTHMLIYDDDSNELLRRSFHQDTPSTIVSASLGTTALESFDVRKIDETLFSVVRIQTAGANGATVTRMNGDGSVITTFVPDLGGETPASIAFAVNKNRNYGVAWSAIGTGHKFRTYNESGTALTAAQTVSASATAVGRRLTVCDHWVPTLSGAGQYWSVFFEDVISTIVRTLVYRIVSGTSVTLKETRFQARLASHAFRVGNRAYVWMASKTPKQATWFLCDQGLRPVGKMDYGLANVWPDDASHLASVNWHTTDSGHPGKDIMVFTGCLSYKQRVPTEAGTAPPNGVFAEPSIHFYTLDFLPPLRSAQAGRCTYFAGAQLWQYDGIEFNESGFHMAPESLTLTPATGGSMGSSGDYQYRVELCYKNKQNEEVRSWSLIHTVTMGASDTQVTLTIPHLPFTRREDAYFLVYRTEKNLTSFYLVSSRDPVDIGAVNGFVKNDPSTGTHTFIDRMSDANAAVREFHPANSSGYLEPLPPPACEIVAAGRDRLWLAGGELAPGEVAPSRLFFPGEAPSFTPAINIQVDRGSEPITAIGFTGKIAVVFRRTGAYTIEGDGPDNLAQGAFFPAQPALTAVGAIGPEGLAACDAGLFFQSPVGIRLLSPSGQLITGAAGGVIGLGQDVDPLAVDGNYAAAVTVPSENQIRWYSRDASKPTLVYDYSANTWVTWTGVNCVGAAFWHPEQTVILTRPDGRLWRQTPDFYYDDDRTYEMVVKTAWLHAGNLGDFQRFRRMALFGEAERGLNLRIRYFYDEREFYEEEQIVPFPAADGSLSQFNTSVWGGLEWGGSDGDLTANSWGDANGANGGLGLFFRDARFRVRKRPHRQKCSVFAVEFSDQGHTSGGFIPAVLALELGARAGLDRVPTGAGATVYGEI